MAKKKTRTPRYIVWFNSHHAGLADMQRVDPRLAEMASALGAATPKKRREFLDELESMSASDNNGHVNPKVTRFASALLEWVES